MKNNKLLLLILIIASLSFLISVKNYSDIKSLYCDLNKSVFAEREYIYPILRNIGDPDKYGKGITNPFTSDLKYLKHCK